jgi:hypothetical protein
MSMPFLAVLVAPRLLFASLWYFTDKVEIAFGDNWYWPVLGITLFPWATSMYVVAYLEGEGLTSGKWILVGLAACADVVTWFARMPERRHRYP